MEETLSFGPFRRPDGKLLKLYVRQPSAEEVKTLHSSRFINQGRKTINKSPEARTAFVDKILVRAEEKDAKSGGVWVEIDRDRWNETTIPSGAKAYVAVQFEEADVLDEDDAKN